MSFLTRMRTDHFCRVELNPRYLRCGACGQIIPGRPWEIHATTVTPCCGVIDRAFLQWPNPRSARYHQLSSRFRLSHKNPDDTDIAIVMLAIAAEAAMDELIWDMLYRKLRAKPQHVLAEIETLSSRTKRLAYFEAKTGISAEDALKEHPTVHSFVGDWDVVTGLRNSIAHGRCNKYRAEDSPTGKNLLVPARRFRELFFEGFAALTNVVYRPEGPSPFKSELRVS